MPLTNNTLKKTSSKSPPPGSYSTPEGTKQTLHEFHLGVHHGPHLSAGTRHVLHCPIVEMTVGKESFPLLHPQKTMEQGWSKLRRSTAAVCQPKTVHGSEDVRLLGPPRRRFTSGDRELPVLICIRFYTRPSMNSSFKYFTDFCGRSGSW